MNAFQRALRSIAVIAVGFAGMAAAAGAADLSGPVILVASERLAGSPFEQTVILATPLPQGGYMGIVVNRPTGVKLESVLPSQASARNVVDQVYAGGPMLQGIVFAVTREVPAEGSKAVPLMPGLVAVMDGESIDRILETAPNAARYFVGLMVWEPGELDDQIGKGAWEMRVPSVQSVLPARSDDLWKILEGPEA
jgi:putative transcriptional regulator